jgi:hypothetical protein
MLCTPGLEFRRQITRGTPANPWLDPTCDPSAGKKPPVSWCQPTVVSSRTRLLSKAEVHLRLVSMAVPSISWASAL